MMAIAAGAAAWNVGLLDEPGSRARLETPALVLDRDAFEANIARLAARTRADGLGLRPHAKTHKCAEIGRRQIAAGALGLACAKPGEVAALFEHGITDLMLTAPVASPRKIDALARIAARGAHLSVVFDRADLVEAFGAAARRHGSAVDVLVDLDVGLARTGVGSADEAVALARAVAACEGLRFAGVQAYAGRVQHVHGFAERRAANEAAMRPLAATLSALAVADLAPRIVSGGGTGSFALDAGPGLLTELQAGSYIFMDEGYAPVDLEGGGHGPFAFSLFVAVSVIAHSSRGYAITDGGSKSFALDGPPPRVYRSGREIGLLEWCGDEFGRVLPHPGETHPPIGTVLECTVPHCDPTVNLHEVYHVVSGDCLLDLWPVTARGRAD